MNEELMRFKIHTPTLLQEIAKNNGIAILKIPLNVLRIRLAEVAQRAIELNYPRLNILILELALYNGEPSELSNAIEAQKKLI